LKSWRRFTAVEQHFRASLPSARFRGEPSQTSKGLVFVQIYALHEYTVLNVVRIASAAIAAHSHTYADLRPSLLALFLDPQLCSLRDTKPKNIWESRLALFDRATSNDPVSLAGLVLPDGNHFRHSHINFILRVFGVTRKLTVRRRHLFLIDEIVENRNSISHRGETAADVGRRYSRHDIFRIIRRLESICLRLILIVSEYCNEPAKHCR
jgi:hypothetical protein